MYKLSYYRFGDMKVLYQFDFIILLDLIEFFN